MGIGRHSGVTMDKRESSRHVPSALDHHERLHFERDEILHFGGEKRICEMFSSRIMWKDEGRCVGDGRRCVREGRIMSSLVKSALEVGQTH